MNDGRRLEGSERETDISSQNPFIVGSENVSFANGFSHNQKLAKENPFAVKGSGLNHNQNVLGPQPVNPYLTEANRARRNA